MTILARRAKSVNGLVALSTRLLVPRLSEMLQVGCLEHLITQVALLGDDGPGDGLVVGHQLEA